MIRGVSGSDEVKERALEFRRSGNKPGAGMGHPHECGRDQEGRQSLRWRLK